MCGQTCERPQVTETTALGAAYLAGIAAGVYESLDEVAELWESEQIFESQMGELDRERRYQGWKNAVARVRTK
jgi:glycerol kinase